MPDPEERYQRRGRFPQRIGLTGHAKYFDAALLNLYKASTIMLEEARSLADSRSILEANVTFGD